MSSVTLSWYRLSWPRAVEASQLMAVSRWLAASGGAPVVVEAIGRAGSVEHRLGLAPSRAESVIKQLGLALPGLAATALDSRTAIEADKAVALRLTTSLRSVRTDQAELVSRGVLTALASTRRGEALVLQWQLLTSLPSARVGNAIEHESSSLRVADILLGRRGKLDAEERQALRSKRELPVWRAVGRIAVKAGSESRQRTLLRDTVNALRLADAPGVKVLAKRAAPALADSFGSWIAPLRLNTAELVAVAGWPIGATGELPVTRIATRQLAPTRAIPTKGRVIGISTNPDKELPIALSAIDGLQHMQIIGPTGVGKSTLLASLITQDIAAGRSVVVIEPKQDLINSILERIPNDRLDDVVLIDPSNEQRPIGLNPLAASGRPPELVADQLLSMFRTLYESSWGPRTNDILGASLLTLARTPGMTLCALPALLGDGGFRRRIVSSLDDPLGLGPFWLAYEEWGTSERAAAIAPVLNKVRPFLMRPQLRAILGQAAPRFDLSQVFSERKVLLVNLAKGLIGPEAAELLGGLILAQLWAASLGRSAVPVERRHPTFIYVDEAANYLRLPTDLGDALAQARGLGVGFVLAHQHLSQFDPAIRAAVLSNARSRICFQLAAADAKTLANGGLAPEDLRELPAFEAYAELVAGGAVQPWCSVRTLPLPSAFSKAADVRRRSAAQYGTDRQQVEAELERLVGGSKGSRADLAPQRLAERGQE